MTKYWVIGGEYESTDFTRLRPGTQEIREGPFVTYAEARAAWARLSWQTVDNCNARYFIREAANAE